MDNRELFLYNIQYGRILLKQQPLFEKLRIETENNRNQVKYLTGKT